MSTHFSNILKYIFVGTYVVSSALSYAVRPTDFLALHGFEAAHKKGLQGQGQGIVFLESGVDSHHPVFKKGQVRAMDVSRYPARSPFLKGKEDHASVRYTEQEVNDFENMGQHSSHGNHVIGIAVGQPQFQDLVIRDNFSYFFKGKFKGGASPQASAISIGYSVLYPTKFWEPASRYSGRCWGGSLYSYYQAFSNPKLCMSSSGYDLKNNTCDGRPMGKYEWDWYHQDQKYRKEALDNYNRCPKEFQERLQKPVDDSFLEALLKACTTKTSVINISAILGTICDPLNGFLIPNHVLEKIAQALAKNDKILVLSANNHGENLSHATQASRYFGQLTQHPLIAPRLLIAVNLQENYKGRNINLPSRHTVNIDLSQSSSYPGQNFKNFAVSALGTHILSAKNVQANDQWELGTGTSMSAPVVSALCALWKQKYPNLSASQIVQKIKDTCIPLGDENKFGKGYINAWALMKDDSPKKDVSKKPLVIKVSKPSPPVKAVVRKNLIAKGKNVIRKAPLMIKPVTKKPMVSKGRSIVRKVPLIHKPIIKRAVVVKGRSIFRKAPLFVKPVAKKPVAAKGKNVLRRPFFKAKPVVRKPIGIKRKFAPPSHARFLNEALHKHLMAQKPRPRK